MGRRFDVVYDDFTGGHFVGPSQANQPRNTWVGNGVICTADEGFLMPDGGWVLEESIAVTSAAETTWPTRVIDDTGDHGVVFAKGTSAYRYRPNSGILAFANTFASPGPRADAKASRAFSSVLFGGATGGTVGYRLIPNTEATSSLTLSAASSLGMWIWNNFALHVGAGSNKLWFSAAGDPASWPAVNFLAIGDVGVPIVAVVPTADDLLVATQDAWWSITGVLGETTVVRRLSKSGIQARFDLTANDASSGVYACESSLGILHPSLAGEALRTLRGTLSFPVIHIQGRAGGSIAAVLNCGDYVLVHEDASDGRFVWVWSESQRRWRCTALPATPLDDDDGTFGGVRTAEDPTGAPDNTSERQDFVAIATATVNGDQVIQAYTIAKDPLQPVSTAGAFDSATVTLAETQRQDPFRVRGILAEVDFGEPATQTGRRSISAQALTNAISDLPATFARDGDGNAQPAGSTVLTRTWDDATATKVGDREMVRFGTSDGATTYTAAPRVTLQGVKLRRLVMQCEEVS